MGYTGLLDTRFTTPSRGTTDPLPIAVGPPFPSSDGTPMSTSFTAKAFTVLNTVLIVVVAYVLLRRGGLVSTQYQQWTKSRAEHRLLVARWDALASEGATLNPSQPGPVRLVIFSDYECPWCRKLHPTLQAFVAGPHAVRIQYRNFPLSIHKHADGAARAAICAEAQGRFQQMHARLFETDGWQSTGDWMQEAIAVAVPDTAAFRRCLAAASTAERIADDVRLGQSLGIQGTPALIVRGAKRESALSEPELAGLVAGSR